MAQGEDEEDEVSGGDGEDEVEDSDDVRCALVEFVRGLKVKKWSMDLGQAYQVGRVGTGADIEVDHPSISRRQCSLAITRVETGLVLVALDPGSTNGTFVNKERLEKGKGLTKDLSEVKYLSFGECPNGYRFLVSAPSATERAAAAAAAAAATASTDEAEGHGDRRRGRRRRRAGGTGGTGGGGGDGGGRSRSRSGGGGGRRRGGALGPAPLAAGGDEWRKKAEAALRLKEEVKRRSEASKATAEGGRDLKSRQRSAASASAAKSSAAGGVEIEWPEDWR